MRGAAAVALLVVTGLLGACDTSEYAFKVDKSIEIVQPKARTEVSLPVQVRWTDARPPSSPRVDLDDAAAEYYAVFLDQSPMGPGKSLESLLDDRDPCRPGQQCPNAEQLSALRIFLVADPRVTLEFVADRRPSRGDGKDTHEVAIVRMRGNRRVGESAFLQTFFVRR